MLIRPARPAERWFDSFGPKNTHTHFLDDIHFGFQKRRNDGHTPHDRHNQRRCLLLAMICFLSAALCMLAVTYLVVFYFSRQVDLCRVFSQSKAAKWLFVLLKTHTRDNESTSANSTWRALGFFDGMNVDPLPNSSGGSLVFLWPWGQWTIVIV